MIIVNRSFDDQTRPTIRHLMEGGEGLGKNEKKFMQGGLKIETKTCKETDSC